MAAPVGAGLGAGRKPPDWRTTPATGGREPLCGFIVVGCDELVGGEGLEAPGREGE